MNIGSDGAAVCLAGMAVRPVQKDKDGYNPTADGDDENCGSAGSLTSRRPGRDGTGKLTLTPPPGP